MKGEINLNKVATINEDKVTGDYGKSLWGKASGTYSGDLRAIVLWTQDRLWIFQADSTEDCSRWFAVLKSYVTIIAGAFSTVPPTLPTKSNVTDNDSDEDSVE